MTGKIILLSLTSRSALTICRPYSLKAFAFRIVVRPPAAFSSLFQVIFLPSAFRGVFARLSQPAEFRQARLQDGVLTWPGELDLAPDAMHQAIAQHGQWVLD